MRIFLQLLAVYLIILLLLLATLQFDLIARGRTTIKNFAFVTGMYASNFKPVFTDNVTSYKDSQTEEPQHPLRAVFGKSDGRTILVPNSSQLFDGSWVKLNSTNITINSVGMRDYEYSYKKLANVCRIAILGDSYTFGWGVELNETFTKVLEHKLNSDKNRAYQVLNFGIPSYGLPEETQHLQKSVVKFNPDAIIFAFMQDDLRNWTRYGEILNERTRTFDETYPEHMGKNLSDFRKAQILRDETFSILKKEENEQFYGSLKEQELIEKYFSVVQDTRAIYNFSVIITVLVVTEKYKTIVKNIADKHNWTFVDASEVFDRTKYEITKVWIKPPSDAHPTPYAHQLIAEKLHTEINWADLCSKAFNNTLSAS